MSRKVQLRRSPRTLKLFGLLLMLLAGLGLLISADTTMQPMLALVLLAVGLICLSYFNRLIIDEASKQLVHQRGCFIPLLNKRYALAKVRSVNIATRVVRDGDNERTTFPVRLSGIKNSTILKHSNPWFSRVIAEQLARLIRVKMVNRVYGVTTTREPQELDLPLIDRWTRDGERLDKPGLPPGTKLIENHTAGAYQISIAAQHPKLKFLVLLLFLLVVPGVFDIGLSNIFHSHYYRFFTIFPAVGGTMLLAFIGRSRLRITPHHIFFRQGWFPLQGKMRLEAIEEMVVAGDGITFIGDTSAVWIHWGGGQKDSDYLEKIVPFQVLRYGQHNVQAQPGDGI